MMQPLWNIVCQFFKRLNIELPYELAIPVLVENIKVYLIEYINYGVYGLMEYIYIHIYLEKLNQEFKENFVQEYSQQHY